MPALPECSESDGSVEVPKKGRPQLPWPVYFPEPRNWPRWSLFRNEERALWHALKMRLGDKAPPRYSNLVVPPLPVPGDGLPGIAPKSVRMKNPWRYEEPGADRPPMRLWSKGTHFQSLEAARNQAEEEARQGIEFRWPPTEADVERAAATEAGTRAGARAGGEGSEEGSGEGAASPGGEEGAAGAGGAEAEEGAGGEGEEGDEGEEERSGS